LRKKEYRIPEKSESIAIYWCDEVPRSSVSHFLKIEIYTAAAVLPTKPYIMSSAGGGAGPSHAWEDTAGDQIWDKAVQEDAEGNIVVAAKDSLTEAVRKRRKLLERQDYSQRHRRVVRDMIRYVYVLIDASRWTRVKDPVFPGGGTRIDVVTKVLSEFVQEFYDQNPVSHLGFVLVKQGEAEILTQLSGNSKAHKLALQSVADGCAAEGPAAQGGEFSLQNGLEVAGRSLGHQPRHGSREIVIVTAALSTCDPGFLLTETLPKLQQANVRVSCIALAAEMYICRKVTEVTAGSMGVCIDLQHLRDWLMAQCTPPPTHRSDQQQRGCEMILMGFPSRTSQEVAELVHAGPHKTLLSRTAFTCPQCQGRNSELPTDCAVCGLKLVLAPHLARSFHHLFPVPPFVDKPGTLSPGAPTLATPEIQSSHSMPMTKSYEAMALQLESKLVVTSQDTEWCCQACLRPLVLAESGEMLRFQCPDCKNLYCVDCDAFIHNSLHNCPGCLGQ
jgi:transcription initiation factor TFIIH subunit 2